MKSQPFRATAQIQWLQERPPGWSSLNSLIAVTGKRELKDNIEEETRYFISSLDAMIHKDCEISCVLTGVLRITSIGI